MNIKLYIIGLHRVHRVHRVEELLQKVGDRGQGIFK
jgi:hypothetical protein